MKRISSFLKVTILLAGLTSLILVFGYYVSGESGLYMALTFSLILNFISYWFSDKIVLSMAHAKPASWESLGSLGKKVENLCVDMNIPMPKLYIMESMQSNAFATGRNPNNGVVCLTTGIMKELDSDQLLGVIAHELAHIKNYDILIASIAAVIASAISTLQSMAFWFGGGDRENRNPVVLIVLLITAPIIAMLLQFAISRSREYEADRTAATYTKNPQALASALVSIDGSVRSNPNREVNQSMASLFIHNPFSGRKAMELFSTHPLTEKRVEKLMSM